MIDLEDYYSASYPPSLWETPEPELIVVEEPKPKPSTRGKPREQRQ